MSDVISRQVGFPDDNVSSETKSGKKWGKQAAEAIYEHAMAHGPNLFYNQREEYQTYRDYALGEQGIDSYKPMLGINPSDSKGSMLKAIKWSIKNYATKRVNIVTEKIASQRYDVSVDPIDPISVQHKEDYISRLKIYIKNKEWLSEVGLALGSDFTPGGLSEDELPQNDEEIEIHAQMNMKSRASMELEMGINRHLERTRYVDKKKMAAFDAFVLGTECFYVGMDENFSPIVERKDPSRLLLPWSEDPLYKNRKYSGYIEEVLISDLMKKSDGEITKTDIQTIKNQANTVGNKRYSRGSYYDRKGDVEKVEVLHFEIKTSDVIVGVEKPDKAGNMRFYKKDFDYFKTPEEQKKFREKYAGVGRKLIRKRYNCVYEGYWVVGTDIIFRYGKRKNQEREYGNYGDSLFGYKVYSPNLYNGRTVSTVKQMIPVLDNLQMYALKMRQAVLSSIPKGFYIDLHALRTVQLDLGEGKLETADLLKMIVQSGIVVADTQESYSAQGDTRKPVEVMDFGLSDDIVYYLQLIQQELYELDEIIGMNAVTAASNVPERQGKKVTEIQQQNSEIALSYLYDGDRIIFEEIAKSLARLHILAMKYGDTKRFKEVFGQNSVDFTSGIIGKDLGLVITPSTPAEEWQSLYLDVKEAVKAGLLPMSAEIAVMEISNLKMARRYIQVQERKMQRMRAEEAEQTVMLNSQEQQKSAELAHSMKMQEKEFERESMLLEKREERKNINLEKEWDMKILEREIPLRGEVEKEVNEEKIQDETSKELLTGTIDARRSEKEKKEERKGADSGADKKS